MVPREKKQTLQQHRHHSPQTFSDNRHDKDCYVTTTSQQPSLDRLCEHMVQGLRGHFQSTTPALSPEDHQPKPAPEQRQGPVSHGKSEVLNPFLLQAFRGLLLNCAIDPCTIRGLRALTPNCWKSTSFNSALRVCGFQTANKKYCVQSMVGWIHRYETWGYRGLNVYLLKKIHI